ncbi:hypothetical protein THRCLA_22929 [Thraustotheca clavata]|uniref:Uncharacterized protein n=1 Tax=Thraustotheca clavata TaxID=74557 RepID=A0A1V9YNE6_9STRA|nr:hypothetical protein THRCLA_22929 [Thraustotheca clavata]
MPRIAAQSEFMCKYTYKPCTNPRSIKRNGNLHTLCEFHRNKANTIQREYARKKRSRKAKAKHNSAISSEDATIYMDKPTTEEESVLKESDMAMLKTEESIFKENDGVIAPEDWVVLLDLFSLSA